MHQFGSTKDGSPVHLFTLQSDNVEVGIMNYGATIVFLKCKSKDGILDDVVTGFENFEDYLERSKFFGCVVGRYGNRIANGKFNLDEVNYRLAINNGPNSLHGGIVGFDKKIWETEAGNNSITFKLLSQDGDEGYPGDLTLSVTYTLKENELLLDYHATSRKATPINLTNHSYFNLGGHSSWGKDLSGHKISVNSDEYLPADENCLVTGEIRSVEGSHFDLRKPTSLTEGYLNSIEGGGIDHTYCLSLQNKRRLAATFYHKASGRQMSVETTQPGVQIYTSNFLSGQKGKQGVEYGRHTCVCFETQNWPDAINQPAFPNCVLRPGEVYSHQTWFTFSTTNSTN